jgi:prepilin-type N-terminal cleavage/methylation domain-containing protein
VAFTLIEVLLAIAIFSMVLAAIYSSWTSILRSAKVGLDAAAYAQRTRVALRSIEEALSSAQLFTGNMQYYWFKADTSGDFASLSFVARLPASFPGSGLFGNQVLRRVTFTNEPGVNGRTQLVLKQTPLLEAPEAGAKPYAIVLAPSVSLFALEFLDTNRWEWIPEWPYTNRLPKMVRVAVSFGENHRGPSSPEETSIQTVLLSSVAIPRELQVSPGRVGAMAVPPVGSRRVPTSPTPVPAPGAPGTGLR